MAKRADRQDIRQDKARGLARRAALMPTRVLVCAGDSLSRSSFARRALWPLGGAR